MTTKIRRGLLLLIAGYLGPLPALADPPFRDLLFEVPLNLAELPAIISKVAVECEVRIRYVYPTSQDHYLVRTGTAEANVVGGAVSQAVQVLVTLPSITRRDPPNATPTTSYTCKLRAFLDEGLGWHSFEPAPDPGTVRGYYQPSTLQLTPATGGSSQLPTTDRTGFIQWPASP